MELGAVASGSPVTAQRLSVQRRRQAAAWCRCRCRAAALCWRLARLDSSGICPVFLEARCQLLPCCCPKACARGSRRHPQRAVVAGAGALRWVHGWRRVALVHLTAAYGCVWAGPMKLESGAGLSMIVAPDVRVARSARCLPSLVQSSLWSVVQSKMRALRDRRAGRPGGGLPPLVHRRLAS